MFKLLSLSLLYLFILGVQSWEVLRNQEHFKNQYEENKNPKYVIELIDSEIDPNMIANEHEIIFASKIDNLKPYYLFEGEPIQKINSKIKRIEKQELEFHYKRNLPHPKDPLYIHQWHIDLVTEGEIESEIWSKGINGAGVTIAFIDDGLEFIHPDIFPNYNSSLSWDFNDNDSDPSPTLVSDAHGTCCAGVAAARDNSNCGVGIAPRASIAGIRLISKGFYDYQAASALQFHMNEIDIYSNSWGPKDDSLHKKGPGWLSENAIKNGVNFGRNGKGNIYVWAAGNGRRQKDNTNYDGWASMRETIAVSAMNHLGEISWYSEEGASILVTVPSSGANWGITTTDLIGYMGSSRTECTYGFGGTSSSAPFASGIIALLLQVNSNLTWRDIQSILVYTSKKIDERSSGWVINGKGLNVNHNYGFGLINPISALNYINDPNFKHVGEEKIYTLILDNINQGFTKNNPLSFSFTIEEEGDDEYNLQIEHVFITLDIEHSRRGDLVISLESPSGTISYLSRLHSDTQSNYNWKFMSVHYWGEHIKGDWILRIKDERIGHDNGILKNVIFNVFGEK